MPMQSLKITAELFNGFASSDPWSPSIDGILAWAHLRQKFGDVEFAAQSVDSSQMQPVDELPLAKTEWNGLWWYQCSSPIYETQAEFFKYFHRRFDAFNAERYMGPKKGCTDVSAGPYKNARLTTRQIVTREVAWHAIGDRERIEALLAGVPSIGHKTGSGSGRVRRWRVELGDLAGGTRALLCRPLPVEYAREISIEGMIMDWGIRPPGRIRINQQLCIMPRQ
jgi:CRISPR type IV-associated protein Csf3